MKSFGQRFGGALSLALWNDPTRWSIVERITLNQFGVVGAGLAAIGLVLLFKRSWRAALVLLGTLHLKKINITDKHRF